MIRSQFHAALCWHLKPLDFSNGHNRSNKNNNDSASPTSDMFRRLDSRRRRDV